MTTEQMPSQRTLLRDIARHDLIIRGLDPDFSPSARAQLDGIHSAATSNGTTMRDLRGKMWCSIDNDDSLDLDQLTVSEETVNGTTRILVAIADVDAVVARGSPLDEHAQRMTTSIYTAAAIFPMFPEKLSTDLTSLSAHTDRCAMVIDMTIADDGSVTAADLYPGMVRNQAKLAYNSVAAWLDGHQPMPPGVNSVPGLAENIRLQDKVAHHLAEARHRHGALDLQTIEARAIFHGDELLELTSETENRAKSIIEEFMVAANGVTARYLSSKGSPAIRRVVRTPKYWDRIVDIAAVRGTHLPTDPDSRALDQFLVSAKAADSVGFPDLSLSIIKLLGRGEYVVQGLGQSVPGHFGLAVQDYAHSTAPNRRFPAVITQRLLKAALTGSPSPYSMEILLDIARHCTQAEDSVKKVERQVMKSAAAILLASRIGEYFDAIVTGASSVGTWVRVLNPPIEGRLVDGYNGLLVGSRCRVQLIHTDVLRGFIDFSRKP
jgi:ribonuclease R